MKFDENGFAVIENVFTDDETIEMRKAGLELCMNAPESDRKVFSEDAHLKENYFIESANKIHYFYENGALDANGNLIVDKMQSLNKVGHALHVLHPIFKKYTFDERIKNVVNYLGMKKPVVPQSMFIYKNPKIGSEGKNVELNFIIDHKLILFCLYFFRFVCFLFFSFSFCL